MPFPQLWDTISLGFWEKHIVTSAGARLSPGPLTVSLVGGFWGSGVEIDDGQQFQPHTSLSCVPGQAARGQAERVMLDCFASQTLSL